MILTLNGAQEQNRTADTGIFSPLLYRLSYLGLSKTAPLYVKSEGVSSSFLNFFPKITKSVLDQGQRGDGCGLCL